MKWSGWAAVERNIRKMQKFSGIRETEKVIIFIEMGDGRGCGEVERNIQEINEEKHGRVEVEGSE